MNTIRPETTIWIFQSTRLWPRLLPASSDVTASPPPKAKIEIRLWQPENKKIFVETAEAARVAVRLLNYPAWHVTVNGQTVTPQRPDDVDQMIVPIDAGKSEIQIRFARTPDRAAGLALSAFSVLMCIGLFRVRKSRPG